MRIREPLFLAFHHFKELTFIHPFLDFVKYLLNKNKTPPEEGFGRKKSLAHKQKAPPGKPERSG